MLPAGGNLMHGPCRSWRSRARSAGQCRRPLGVAAPNPGSPDTSYGLAGARDWRACVRRPPACERKKKEETPTGRGYLSYPSYPFNNGKISPLWPQAPPMLGRTGRPRWRDRCPELYICSYGGTDHCSPVLVVPKRTLSQGPREARNEHSGAKDETRSNGGLWGVPIHSAWARSRVLALPATHPRSGDTQPRAGGNFGEKICLVFALLPPASLLPKTKI